MRIQVRQLDLGNGREGWEWRVVDFFQVVLAIEDGTWERERADAITKAEAAIADRQRFLAHDPRPNCWQDITSPEEFH